jgi:hypothetical protein
VLDGDEGIGSKATFTVGIRHLGLVLAIGVVAPFLTNDVIAAAEVAELNGTAVIIDGRIPGMTKIPLALDIRDALDRTPRGEIPDLSAPFAEHGAGEDPAIRVVQDDLLETIEVSVTRGFRRSFLFCALLAALALVPVLAFRRRWVA